MLAVPENARYIADWGRAGDVALYALDRRDEPVGAAWLRRFTAADTGLRLRRRRRPRALDRACTPSSAASRSARLLLGSIIARAERDRERAISLSVNRENPAKRLYARYGFEVVAEPGDTLTMLLDLP